MWKATRSRYWSQVVEVLFFKEVATSCVKQNVVIVVECVLLWCDWTWRSGVIRPCEKVQSLTECGVGDVLFPSDNKRKDDAKWSRLADWDITGMHVCDCFTKRTRHYSIVHARNMKTLEQCENPLARSRMCEARKSGVFLNLFFFVAEYKTARLYEK